MTEVLELNCKDNFSKIDDIPKIIYLNHDSDLEKKDYMESQFDALEIKNYSRYQK